MLKITVHKILFILSTGLEDFWGENCFAWTLSYSDRNNKKNRFRKHFLFMDPNMQIIMNI